MTQVSRRYHWLVWGVLAITVIAIGLAFVREQIAARRVAAYPPLFEVGSFHLTNQLGKVIDRDSMKGRVWVANVIFTRCAGPCPRMSGLVAELQSLVKTSWPVGFISITTDPEHDSPEVLKRYAARFMADSSRWSFLTGSKEQVKRAAVDALKFTALPKEPAQQESAADLFIHSTVFVVIDKKGWVRAVMESEERGAREKILGAIDLLASE